MNNRQIRSIVAIVVAVGTTALILVIVDGLAPGLTTGTIMRDTLGRPGAEAAQYESFTDLWIGVRIVLAVYITVVAGIVTLQSLVALREHAAGFLPLES